jgi:hypothetical protein
MGRADFSTSPTPPRAVPISKAYLWGHTGGVAALVTTTRSRLAAKPPERPKGSALLGLFRLFGFLRLCLFHGLLRGLLYLRWSAQHELFDLLHHRLFLPATEVSFFRHATESRVGIASQASSLTICTEAGKKTPVRPCAAAEALTGMSTSDRAAPPHRGLASLQLNPLKNSKPARVSIRPLLERCVSVPK